MNNTFNKLYNEKRQLVESAWVDEHPEGYYDIVERTLNILTDSKIQNLQFVESGSYQGTIAFLFVYDDNIYVGSVSYGSCSVCDTFQAIQRDGWTGEPTEQQAKDYATLALHIIQGIKEIY